MRLSARARRSSSRVYVFTSSSLSSSLSDDSPDDEDDDDDAALLAALVARTNIRVLSVNLILQHFFHINVLVQFYKYGTENYSTEVQYSTEKYRVEGRVLLSLFCAFEGSDVASPPLSGGFFGFASASLLTVKLGSTPGPST